MNKSPVHVVIRNGRRIESENYPTRRAANQRAKALREMLKEWQDPDLHRVEIVKTTQPNKFR